MRSLSRSTSPRLDVPTTSPPAPSPKSASPESASRTVNIARPSPRAALMRSSHPPRSTGRTAGPARQPLVARLGVVELGLRHRHLVDDGSADAVPDADRDRLEAGQHVELGQHEVGEAVDACGITRNDCVVPPAPPRAAGRRTEL